MQVTLDIPDDIAECLRAAWGENLAVPAVEQIALAGYHAGTLSRYQVQRLLGFDNRWDAEEWLGRCRAHAGYSAADLEGDRAALDRLLGGRP